MYGYDLNYVLYDSLPVDILINKVLLNIKCPVGSHCKNLENF